MYVKRLEEMELSDALQLVSEVFAEEVAPCYSSQGVEEFEKLISYDQMRAKVQNRELAFFLAVEGSQLCGVSAICPDGHIALLFVRKAWQRKGAARRLFHAMQQYCVLEQRVIRMTVNAAPGSAEAYQHLGFVAMAEEQEEQGIRYIPMEYLIKEAREIAASLNALKPRRPMTMFLLAGLLGLFLVLSAAFDSFVGNVISEYKEAYETQQDPTPSGEAVYDIPQEEETTEATGIEAIEPYLAEGLPYQIEEETYTFYSEQATNGYRMQFVVGYPQLKGWQSEKQEEINQILKECAMSTVDALYLNPTQEMKEAMLQYTNPVLASEVTYKVTYATDGFLSVAFNDVYYAGDSSKGYVDLRTRNINLKDGSVYEVKDVAELTNAFMRDWKTKMDQEAPGATVLQELRTSEFRKILNGETLDGKYFQAFFVDQEGIEIGFTYHHASGETVESGWITAPFTMQEIKAYQPDGALWELIK